MRTVTRNVADPRPEDVQTFCKTTRVRVQAYPRSRLPDCLDSKGRSLFCVWKVGTAIGRSEGHVIDPGYAPTPKRTSLFEVWTDPGSVLLRAGASLSFGGGNGEFDVQVDSAEEIWLEPELVWLTTWHAAAQPVTEWPPNATVFRLLSGTATFGAVAAVPLVEYSIAAIGSAATVVVQGHFQTGTKV